jgi:transposase InsO family protein
MRLKLHKYPIELFYKPGPQMHISDTLSRASLPITEITPAMPDYMIFNIMEEDAVRKELEDADVTVFVTDERLRQVCEETTKDATLQTLMEVIMKGWPEDKKDVPICIREYWAYRDELITQDGLVFRGTRIVIPTAMRKAMMTRAHASHMGIQYTINSARDIMYWPLMHSDLTQEVQTCNTCQESKPAQAKEPMLTYPIAKHPWQVVASDCFELKGEHYVVLVDTYSDYIEVCPLKDLTSSTLIGQIKQVFAAQGTPAIFISDNGPNYASREFHQFAQSWDFQHISSSPHHHKSNGKAESAVSIVKPMFEKAIKEGKDIWKALLEWRNATTPNMQSSPAQRLMSRRTRSFLPCATTHYVPKVQEKVPEKIIEKRKVAKHYHDQGAKSLPKLVIGQPVRVKTRPQVPHSEWRAGRVVKETAPRSYIVEVNGYQYRRNRIHLRDAIPSKDNSMTLREKSPSPVRPAIAHQPVSNNANSRVYKSPANRAVQRSPLSVTEVGKDMPTSPRAVTPDISSTMTRSGRVVNKPARFRDE